LKLHLTSFRRRLAAGTALVALAVSGAATAASAGLPLNPFGTAHVGTQADGRVLLPYNQWIASYGHRTVTSSLTVGTAISPDGSKVVVHTRAQIKILDAATGAILQAFGGKGVTAPVFSPDGKSLYVGLSTASSGSQGTGSIARYTIGANGLVANPTAPQTLTLGTLQFPYGMAISADGSRLYTVLNGTNSVAVIDTAANQVLARIPVGNAPQDIALVDGKAFVTNRGGRPAVAGDTTNKSDGTAIVSDPVTGASATGTVSVIDLASNTVTDTIEVGLQPSSVTVHDGSVFVTNTNSDTISVIDAASHAVTQTVNVEPLPGSHVGAAPNSVAVTDEGHLLVSVGRDNAIAVYGYKGSRVPMHYQGLIPTDAYPNQVSYDAALGKVIVSNQDGVNTNGAPKSGSVTGTVTSFELPASDTLAALTHKVFENNAWDHINAGTGAAASSGVHPGPVQAIPARLGQPSAIKHVFLIIKENRTYDQVLGDDARGNGNPAFTTYPQNVTPNQHKLAQDFTLFDNFYDNGMVSADGHNWLLQGDNNDYLANDAATQWGRSYPYPGGDALAYQRNGFIWNTVQAAGGTVRNYGEFANRGVGSQGNWQKYWADSQILEGKAGGPLPQPTDQRQWFADVPSLDAVTNHEYPRFDTGIPDQYRTDIWERDFKQAVQSGALPNLTVMTLGDDHTGGAPTGAAQVADNDLAVGRIVSDVSHSPFWNDSAIFVLEDDTQAGSDHVDGHRGPLWIASPYANRGVVNSEYFSQINVVRTIEQILGAQPMNQMDRAAVPMFTAFTNKPDFTPFETLPNNIPLTQGVTGLLQLPPPDAPSNAAPAATTIDGPAAAAVPADKQALADAWEDWKVNVAGPASSGDNGAPDKVNQAQLGRYNWYTATGWTKPFPGDDAIYAPDEVPGRNIPGNLSGD
jgi:YVTN family beta-propeller protein